MDPSALIFVALAVAWAVYLIPKALEHHEEGVRSRSVERFSARLRVLARREPVNRRKARLVTSRSAAASTSAAPSVSTTTSTTTSTTSTTTSTTTSPTPSRPAARARRETAARAARRRRRVVGLILLANAVVATLGWFQIVEWVWCAAPAGALVVWLVACRLMVKRERATASRRRPSARIPAETSAEPPEDATGELAKVDDAARDERPDADPDSWDPVAVPLPTYVSKPVARRTVSTIDLDSTGVWSSGRNAADTALAREAEAADRVSTGAEAERTQRRATGA